ncbi:MAG: flavodoxin [Actinomycetia bacterium]|nr:flavodoxin [Actinomycetes bacterium]
MSNLLVVYHSRSGGTQAMTDAVVAGATSDEIEDVDVRVRRAPDAGVDDVSWSNAVVLGTPENFGYMSGLMKDFLERIYYPLLDKTVGLSYALYVKASTDGAGAVSSIERILTGLHWKAVQQPFVIVGDVTAEHLEHCHDLGMTMAAGLEAGIY